jgi:DNA-binding transcriptional MerR regulator
MARKKAQAFRTITEVSDWLDTPSHVLRFWESKFPQIKPVKRAGGRRYYRPEDLKLIGGIKHLLHDKGTTIASVKEMIKTDGEESVEAYSAEPVFPEKGRRKKRKTAAAAAATAVSTETQETQKEEILTLDAEIEAAPQTEPLVLEPAAIQSEPLQLEPAPLSPLVLEVSEDTEERETSARDVISNAVSRTLNEQTEATTNDEASSELNLSLGQLKSRTQIASDRVLDIEDMYFQLQRIRNRMKRRLEALG